MATGAKTRSRPRGKSPAGGTEDFPQLMLWEESPAPDPAPRKRRTKAAPAPPEVARAVGQEILGGELNPAEWASALAGTGNDDSRAIAEYARLRMARLSREHVRTECRALETEMRKLHFCGSAATNVRRRKTRSERPAATGAILTFIGLWGLSASLIGHFQTLSGTLLISRSAIAAVALSAVFCGVYFLTGKSFRRLFSGDRTLGVGALLCGFSLILALAGTLSPEPAKPGISQSAPSRRPLAETLVVPTKENPRVSFR